MKSLIILSEDNKNISAAGIKYILNAAQYGALTNLRTFVIPALFLTMVVAQISMQATSLKNLNFTCKCDPTDLNNI